MPWRLILPRAATLLGLVCLVCFEWGGIETLRASAGAFALWGPFAALIFLWLRPAVSHRGERLALSLTGSYAATALLYFSLAVLEAAWLFSWLQVAAGAVLLTITSWRTRVLSSLVHCRDWKCDWWLAALVVMTLLVSARYRVAFDRPPHDSSRHFRLYHDQTYHTALAYELGRHTPPLQQPTQAGKPDRAYHLFPHLGTMLLARYAGQSDLLHTQTTWSFVVLTVLVCLCLHHLVRQLAGADSAGYLAVALLFILAIPFPPIIQNPLGYFHCSLYPHMTSLLEPVVMTAPQMYSGLVVFFGIMLGVVTCERAAVRSSAGPAGDSLRGGAGSTEIWRTMLVIGVMTGALLRFRAHVFLPFAPLFCLVGSWLAWRLRDWRVMAGVGLAVIVSMGLLVEMRQPIYQAGTAQFSIGYNGLTWPGTSDQPNPAFQWWWVCWPGARFAFEVISGLLPGGIAMWVWHAICIFGFLLFQVVGLPLAMAAALYVVTPSSWRDHPLSMILIAGLVGGSMLGAMVLNFQGESYSLAGQMLLHICWYVFPVFPVVLWSGYRRVSARMAFDDRQIVVAVACVLAFATTLQLLRGPSSLEALCHAMGFTLTSKEWDALQFLRHHTPEDAVVLMPLRPQPGLSPGSPEAKRRQLSEAQNFAICGSLGGRATYIEYAHAPHDLERVREVIDLWHAPDHGEFSRRLGQTKATYLVEYPGDSPKCFEGGPPPCLQSAWESPAGPGQVRIWRVRPVDGDMEASDGGS